jgi:outer membrane lipoprotein-sorting protein
MRLAVKGAFVWLCLLWSIDVRAQPGQDATKLFYGLRDRMSAVKDYVATVRMKIDVTFMRVPLLAGKLYYKAPGKLKFERAGGISILPRKSVTLSIDKMVPAGDVTVLDAGKEIIDGLPTHVIKVIPEGESDIVLAKVWIDEARMLALRTETTTRDNGTARMELSYDKYAAQALPDRVVFVMDVKEYKLPKGVTMDYDEGTTPVERGNKQPKLPKKGRIEIRYLNYQINVGLSDAVFTEQSSQSSR